MRPASAQPFEHLMLDASMRYPSGRSPARCRVAACTGQPSASGGADELFEDDRWRGVSSWVTGALGAVALGTTGLVVVIEGLGVALEAGIVAVGSDGDCCCRLARAIGTPITRTAAASAAPDAAARRRPSRREVCRVRSAL